MTLEKQGLDLALLEKLLSIHGPSGEETQVRDFIIEQVAANQKSWKKKPKLIYGDGFQDCLLLVFGEKPSTVIFAHMDTIGFTCRYENQLVPIGSPDAVKGYQLTGSDPMGPISCSIKLDEDDHVFHDFPRSIQRGTSLVFAPDFRHNPPFVQSPYMDNRLGVYVALQVASTLQSGVIAFSTYEEHGGGSVPFLLNYLMAHYPLKQALIADITWVTDGVEHGKGVVVSMRDRNIPRKSFIDRICTIATKHHIPFQLEVEGSGSSDGREVQLSPFPLDWVFIGAPEANVHTPNEKVHIDDIFSMINLYRILMQDLN